MFPDVAGEWVRYGLIVHYLVIQLQITTTFVAAHGRGYNTLHMLQHITGVTCTKVLLNECLGK